MDERVEKIKEKLIQQIIKLIESEELFGEQVWVGQHNYLTNHTYSGYNAMILSVHYYLRGYNDPRWMTKYQMFKNYLEFKNPEDENTGGVDIYFYKTIDYNTKKTFNPISKFFTSLTYIEKEEYEKKYVRFECYVPYTVYNCSLIDGIKPFRQSQEDIKAKNDYLENIIQNPFVPIYYGGWDSAYYSAQSDSICLPEKSLFKSLQGFYGVVMHEMAHATGHPSRLDREKDIFPGDEDYAYEELVAEFSSILMQLEFGCSLSDKHIKNHAAYLQAWKNYAKETPDILSNALSEANRIMAYIKKRYKQ
jgi:antirestriction protein ArdC